MTGWREVELWVCCEWCGGEGVVGGLAIGDHETVDEACYHCHGTGLVLEDAES